MHTDFLSFSLIHKKFRGFSSALVIALSVLLAGSPVTAQDNGTANAGGAPAATGAPSDNSTASAAGAGGDVAKGQELFTNQCQQCHAVTDEVVVGPGLKGISQRRDEAWLIKWIKNPQAVISSGDPYAVALYNKFAPTVMQSFPGLSDDDIRGIIAYVNSANAPAAPDADGGPVTTTPGQQTAASESPSGLFTFVLVALMVVMLLVLGVLLVIVSILSKAVTGAQPGAATEGTPFFDRLRTNLAAAAGNSTLRSIVIWLFAFIVAKQTVDGLYSIGIQQGYAPKQPIAFSHKLHAGQYQINCNYCHTGVNKGKSAHIPSANICMNCHGVIKKESPEIQKIYQAIEKDQPIEWVRVHNLPDLAYFNHAQHVNVGNIQCQQCHGDVEKMEVMQQRSSLTMGWCIDCHRKTEVNTKDNAYYDKLVALHAKETKEPLKVANIGGLECSKCHY
ncbi:c-type cytochrome [Tellurirhabdus rosea]|uniref:c-type cytochrome n=1 Tax=Tellurirhabdus rosea TaxID=2674997 RepID=UPI0022581E8D|nr:c-type cytochrome [Tellurirhabdus rosea]